MPARWRAAAILPCWVMSAVDTGADCAEERCTTSFGLALPPMTGSGPPVEEILNTTESGFEGVAVIRLTSPLPLFVRMGVGVTVMPGFSANVPRTKRAFLGLMQYSSMRVLWFPGTL